MTEGAGARVGDGRRGLFILVAGPSGAGKDTLIDAIRARRPDLSVTRRIITRAAGSAGEDHSAVTLEDFERLEADGAFLMTWRAHGLAYALPADVEEALARGRGVIANLSRAAIAPARERFDPLLVLLVTAPIEVLAQRLAARGRETPAEIQARLARADQPAPSGPEVVEIDNGGALDDALAQALQAIEAAETLAAAADRGDAAERPGQPPIGNRDRSLK